MRLAEAIGIDRFLEHLHLAEECSRTYRKYGKTSPQYLEACRLRDESLERIRAIVAEREAAEMTMEVRG